MPRSDPAWSQKPLLGHRAAKKRRTRSRILEKAIEFFLESGVREARSAAIAEASGVSPATLFNYFATRQDLAEAWVRGELIEEVERAVDRAAHPLRASLRQVGRELAKANLRQRARRLEAWQLAGRSPGATYAEAPALARLIAKEQADGRLRSDLDARRLTSLLLEAFEGGLIEALGEATDAREAERLMRSRVDLILDGARKRNERVAVSTLATGGARAR